MEVNKEKIKTGVWAAIGGAILTMIIGFAWGGWVTSGTAQSRAEKMAADAVVARLVPICVAQFNQDQEKDKKLKAVFIELFDMYSQFITRTDTEGNEILRGYHLFRP